MLYLSPNFQIPEKNMAQESGKPRLPKTLTGFRQLSERMLHGIVVALFFEEPLLTACAEALSKAGFRVVRKSPYFDLQAGSEIGYSLIIIDQHLIVGTTDARLKQASWSIVVGDLPDDFETKSWSGQVAGDPWPELARALIICLFKESKIGPKLGQFQAV